MYKAKLFKKLPDKKIQCTACQRYCLIGEAKTGFCLGRKNIGGELYSLIYGRASGVQIDPIEKKPLRRFRPGTEVLSVGSFGCNFRCKQCQNWHISWGKPAASRLRELEIRELVKKEYISPENLIELTIKGGYPGIAFTYNEPAIWPEYVYDTATLAKKAGLYTVFVSNGSWTKEAMSDYGRFIDAANIDFKGWGEKVYERQGAFWGKDFLKNLILAKEKYHIHLELTTLIIPSINDDFKELTAISRWIAKNLGEETPWHLLSYHPESAKGAAFRKIPATPEMTLKKAYNIGKKSGLKYVYV